MVAVARASTAGLVLALLLALPAAAEEARAGEPAEVHIGAYILDVQDVDLLSHSYAVDLYVWLRWTDPSIDPSETLQLVNPYELWGMTRTQVYDEPQRLPDGSLRQMLRFHGRFSSSLPVDDYPFDSQRLTIAFQDDAHDESSIVFVPDTDPVTIDPAVTLPGYVLGAPTLTVVNEHYPTTFGDTSEPEPAPYSRVTIAIPATRPVVPYLVKLALPILLVVIVAALSFLLHSSYVEARIGMGITALLTLVALQLTMNSGMPSVGYLTMLDLVYIASFVFVLAVMAQAVATSWLAQRGEHDRAVALDRRMVVVASAAYTAVVGLIFLLYAF